MENLRKKRVAILATNGFEESELKDPKKALEQAGAHVTSFLKMKETLDPGTMAIGENRIW